MKGKNSKEKGRERGKKKGKWTGRKMENGREGKVT